MYDRSTDDRLPATAQRLEWNTSNHGRIVAVLGEQIKWGKYHTGRRIFEMRGEGRPVIGIHFLDSDPCWIVDLVPVRDPWDFENHMMCGTRVLADGVEWEGFFP